MKAGSGGGKGERGLRIPKNLAQKLQLATQLAAGNGNFAPDAPDAPDARN